MHWTNVVSLAVPSGLYLADQSFGNKGDNLKGLPAVTAVMVVYLLNVSVAGAAVVSGSVDDARGDVPLTVADEHPRDLQSFEMRYDDDQGVLSGTIKHWDPQLYLPGYFGHHWFGFRADVGVAHRNGTCDVASRGSVSTRFSTPDDTPAEVQWATATIRKGGAISGDFTGDNLSEWTYTLKSPELVGRGYNCVSNVQATHYGSGTVDRAAGFCMGASGTQSCPTRKTTKGARE